MIRLNIFLLFSFLLIPCSVYAQTGSEGTTVPKGPLVGKNLYLPFAVYYTYPGFPAQPAEEGAIGNLASVYYLNDVKTVGTEDIFGNPVYYTIQDYESMIIEYSFFWQAAQLWQFGTALRVQAFYGGFLDAPIEWFHQFFGLPNEGRDYIAMNQLNIDVVNKNSVNIMLDHAAFVFGDMDIWARWSFFSSREIYLAVLAAVKLPTGFLSGISAVSSGYPDLAFQVLADWHPLELFSFYAQAGLTVPADSFWPGLESDPYPFFQGMICTEFHPDRAYSVILQLNIKTRVLSGYELHFFFQQTDRLSLPQLNILTGIKWRTKDLLWQAYIEEDAITNQGADITVNFSAGWNW